MTVARGPGGVALASASGSTITVTDHGYGEGVGVLAVLCWGTAATITGVPTGFTLVASSALSLSTNVRSAVYENPSFSGDPDDLVWTMSATGSFGRCLMHDYTGVEPTGFATGVVSGTATNSNTVTWPAITRSGIGAIVCYGSQATSRTPSAAPTNYTDQYTTVPRFGYFFDRMDAPTGVNASFSRTLDNGSGGHALGRLLLVAAADSVLAPENTALPEITGTLVVGQELTCSDGTWDNDPTGYTYQWLLDEEEIPDATSSTYTTEAAGDYTCTVTATNDGGSADATSEAVTVEEASDVAPADSGGLPRYNDTLVLTTGDGSVDSRGFLRDASGDLAVTSSTTGATWQQGFLRGPAPTGHGIGPLVIDDEGTGSYINGFLRTSTGALATTTDATGAAYLLGLLRSPDGLLVVTQNAA